MVGVSRDDELERDIEVIYWFHCGARDVMSITVFKEITGFNEHFSTFLNIYLAILKITKFLKDNLVLSYKRNYIIT